MTKVRLIFASFVALLLCSCERDGLELSFSIGPYGGETRKVMLLYEAGFNSLSSDIEKNIAALQQGYLPGKGRNDDVILIFSHLAKSRRVYSVETAPTLVRMYSELGEVRTDTLKVWPVGTPVVNKELMTEVFNWVRKEFPAAGYGAVLSSHATGWLPDGYFNNAKQYEGRDRGSGPGTIVWNSRKKTFGQEYYASGAELQEMELRDLAAAIPYKLDYIMFDACLMATVEVAWALRDVCSYLAFSPCEIPSAGFNYRTLAEHLLKPETPDLKSVCMDYFATYENDFVYGATITMVDCSKLDRLASTCRELFERYRSGIQHLDGGNVQVYDRALGSKDYYIFFDLKDILREAGASEGDLDALQSALDEALVYEAHSAHFIDVILDRCCGLAMYLPAYPDYQWDIYHGTEFLDGFYQENIAWNQATSLVK